MYGHIAGVMFGEKRKCSRWPLVLVASSCLVWSEKLKVQAWAPSRQPVKDVQIYKHVGSRDTFCWRVNMLWLCLYNNCAVVRGRRCLIPGWLGIIGKCTVRPDTLFQFDTYLNVLSEYNLYIGREVTLPTEQKKTPPPKCALNTWIILKCRFAVFCLNVSYLHFLEKFLIAKSYWWGEKVKELPFWSRFFCVVRDVAWTVQLVEALLTWHLGFLELILFALLLQILNW